MALFTFAGVQVETESVQGADNLPSDQHPIGQGTPSMRAPLGRRVNLAASSTENGYMVVADLVSPTHSWRYGGYRADGHIDQLRGRNHCTFSLPRFTACWFDSAGRLRRRLGYTVPMVLIRWS